MIEITTSNSMSVKPAAFRIDDLRFLSHRVSFLPSWQALWLASQASTS